MALLGLVSLLSAARVLSGGGRSGCFHHWESRSWNAAPPARGQRFDHTAARVVSSTVHYISRIDLHPAQGPGSHQSHLQWNLRGFFCRHDRKVVGMKDDSAFDDARRLYLESCGDPMVTNTYLKIALVLLAMVCLGLVLVDLRTIRTFQNFRPLVIRIDDLGRAEAINYHNLEYKPQDAE